MEDTRLIEIKRNYLSHGILIGEKLPDDIVECEKCFKTFKNRQPIHVWMGGLCRYFCSKCAKVKAQKESHLDRSKLYF